MYTFREAITEPLSERRLNFDEQVWVDVFGERVKITGQYVDSRGRVTFTCERSDDELKDHCGHTAEDFT